MRKILVGLFMSLDGVVEAPEKWTFQYYNDDIAANIAANVARSDVLLLGRVTYEGFAASFSGQTGGVADALNNHPKIVVSTTLKSADWNNSTLLKGNVAQEVARLKQQPGKDIAMSGSVALVQSLMAHDLIDEYSLMVYPIVLGTGKRLFNEGLPQTTFKLLEVKPTSTGVVLMRYERDRK